MLAARPPRLRARTVEELWQRKFCAWWYLSRPLPAWYPKPVKPGWRPVIPETDAEAERQQGGRSKGARKGASFGRSSSRLARPTRIPRRSESRKYLRTPVARSNLLNKAERAFERRL